MTNDLLSRAPVSVAGHQRDEQTDSLIAQIRPTVEGREIFADRFPTKAERDCLQRRRASINVALRPAAASMADVAAVEQAAAQVLLGFNVAAENAVGKVKAYVASLKELPLGAALRTLDGVRKQAIPGLDPDYPPSATRLLAIGQKFVEDMHIEKRKIDEALGATRLINPIQTVEQKERLDSKIQAWLAEQEEAQRIKRATITPLTDEDKQRSQDAILREYALHKEEPVYAGGIALSRSLVRKIQGKPE